MMRLYRLVRITSDDYRDYRRTRSKVDYSYFPKGESHPVFEKIVRDACESAIPTKWEFLENIAAKDKAAYFFKDGDEIKGIVELVFTNNECNILEFSVLERGKGLGTIFYEEILKVIKEKRATKIILWCPFPGAQEFWRSMGFGVKKMLGGQRGVMMGKSIR